MEWVTPGLVVAGVGWIWRYLVVIERRLAALDQRVGGLDHRLGALEQRVARVEGLLEAGIASGFSRGAMLRGGPSRVPDRLRRALDEFTARHSQPQESSDSEEPDAEAVFVDVPSGMVRVVREAVRRLRRASPGQAPSNTLD